MNVAEHVRQLREAAKLNRTEGTGHRSEAATHQARADKATAKAIECEDLAVGWDKVADLLEHGGSLTDQDQQADEETARVGTPDIYTDFAASCAVATDVMRTLSDMGLPLHAVQVREGVSIQHIARFGDDAARASLRTVADRLGIDYNETTDLSSTYGGGYTRIEACGPIGGVQVSVWNHVDKSEAYLAGPPVDGADEDSPIPYVLAERAGEEDFADGYLAALDDDRHVGEPAAVPAPAPDFAAGDLVNVSQPKHPHWGTRGKVVGFTDDVPALVAVEYDNFGNCLYLAPAQLMHHTEFVKQSNEYFDAAEAADVRQIERELDVWAGDDSEIDRQVAEDEARAERRAEDGVL